MWQDYTLAICSVVFSAALVPQVRAVFKRRACDIVFKSSVPTAIGLLACAVCYASKGWWFATATTGLSSLLWFTLVAQRIHYGGTQPVSDQWFWKKWEY